MKNYINIIIIIFFSTVLLLPTIAEKVPIFPVVESTENRAMISFPALTFDSLEFFPEEFDEFYSDNIKLRNQFLRLNSYIKFHWFSIPPFSEKAFIGRQGWMFAIKDEMDHYLGRNLFDQDTLNRFIKIINYRKHILDSMNVQYYLVIVPIKTTVYPEFLPISKRISEQKTLTDQLLDTLGRRPDIHVIDLSDALIKQKHEHRVFHKTDNHWNEYGGFVAYKAVMETLSKDFPDLKPVEISNYEIETIGTEGKNLTQMMGIYDGVNESEIICKPKFQRKAIKGKKNNYPPPAYFPYKKSYERVYVTNDTNLPKLLVIQDSFGSTLIPFLSEHFNKSIYIFDGWQHSLNEDILFNEQPDIFIQLVSESLLPNIPKNSNKP